MKLSSESVFILLYIYVLVVIVCNTFDGTPWYKVPKILKIIYI